MEKSNSGDKDTKDHEEEEEEDRIKTSVVPVGSSKEAEKKTVRALAILKKDTGIEESPDVSRVIFVCNAGLVTGCSSSGIWS